MFRVGGLLRGFGPTTTTGVDPLNPPSLAITDNEDGTATFTVSGASSDTTNTVYTRRLNNSTTEEWVSKGSRSGNGTIPNITLVPGLYFAYVLSTDEPGQLVVSEVDHFEVVDSNAHPFGERRLIAFDLQGVPLIYRRRTARTVAASGVITNTFSETTITRVLFAPISDLEVSASNGRYKVGDWRVRIKSVDLPETPPSQNSRVKFNDIEYQIFEHAKSSDRLVWDLFVREIT